MKPGGHFFAKAIENAAEVTESKTKERAYLSNTKETRTITKQPLKTTKSWQQKQKTVGMILPHKFQKVGWWLLAPALFFILIDFINDDTGGSISMALSSSEIIEPIDSIIPNQSLEVNSQVF